MAVRYEFAGDVETVFRLLTNREFLVQRSKDLGERSAGCEIEEAGETTRVIQEREIERELPSFLAKLFSSRQQVKTREEWRRSGDGYAGSFSWEIVGQPVQIKGRFTLKPADGGCLYRGKHDVKVNLPLIGGRAEKYALSEAEKSLLRELEYAGHKLGDG